VTERAPVELIPEVTKVDGAIVAELISARQILRQQAERIRNLEEALEETVTSLDDARSRLAEQEYVEKHLASTEETANVQQQAILLLKNQIQQRDYQLSQKDMAFNQLLMARKSAEQRDQEYLESEMSKQVQAQAQLHQACQELEHEREIQQQRLTELEAQNAVMQEQILSQAQQASEYQTAVQHLKDRYLYLQNQTLSLRQVLEAEDVGLSEEALAILATLPDPNANKRRGIRPFQDLSVDLPGFLKRWQKRED
jgi:chromosome segregation ATPase